MEPHLRVLRSSLLVLFLFVGTSFAQVTIVQLSDLHIGLKRAPKSSENLRRAVEMANQRRPDAVVVTGDIAENSQGWEEARQILSGLKAPVYYVPGNHDVHTDDVDRYRKVFGEDFYRVRIKNVVLYAFNSELLGNFDDYSAKSEAAMQPKGMARDQGERMLRWMEDQAREKADRRSTSGRKKRKGDDDRRSKDSDDSDVVIGMQHIPLSRNGDTPPDSRPYWAISEPYRSRELELLKRLGIRHMLVGHWHLADVFEFGGITWHVAPSTSWLPWGGHLGFAVHTITSDGDMKTEFVNLD